MPTTNEPAVLQGELPDVFARPDGDRITCRDTWPEQAQRWRDLIVDTEYGGLPPAPDTIEIETICRSRVRRWPGAPHLLSYRIQCLCDQQPFSFFARILFPDIDGPFPAIVNGDGCWWYISDEVAQRVIEKGCALVMFNRTEIVKDIRPDDPLPETCRPSGQPVRTGRYGGLYDLYPDHDFGALAAWAWGYHRCVDMVTRLPFVDSSRIAVTGHSRGGKTTLLAGATDERITLVNSNASGTGGGSLFRYIGHGGETLNIVNSFPDWFGSKLRSYLGREHTIPFDQHCLLAAVAPRPLLMTYALDDRWANPEGMVLAVQAAGEVYKFLGHRDHIAFHLREGTHAHNFEDWMALLDFIDWKWHAESPRMPFNQHPYEHLAGLYSRERD